MHHGILSLAGNFQDCKTLFDDELTHLAATLLVASISHLPLLQFVEIVRMLFEKYICCYFAVIAVVSLQREILPLLLCTVM